MFIEKLIERHGIAQVSVWEARPKAVVPIQLLRAQIGRQPVNGIAPKPDVQYELEEVAPLQSLLPHDENVAVKLSIPLSVAPGPMPCDLKRDRVLVDENEHPLS